MKWPYQSTPYLSALPGVGGPGLNVSRGDKPSKIYFITSLENVKEGGPAPQWGPNCYAGTFWWCCYADQGEDFHKWMVPLVSGYSFAGRGLNTPERDNFDYIGHAAPGPGLILQTSRLTVRGSNSRVWHLSSWLGDYPSIDGPDSFQADQRDCFGSSTSTEKIGNVAFINCEARFGMDELVQVWYDELGASWIRGAVYDPLHVPPDFAMGEGSHHEAGNDHGFGHLVGGRADYSLIMQSLYAHTTDRNPLVAAPNHAHINNLHYNHGRMDGGGRGAAVKIDDNGDHNADAGYSMQANIVGCCTVRGPDNGTETTPDAVVLVEVQDVTEGSSAHGALNGQFGWDRLTSQDQFFVKIEPGYLKPTLRTGAWPLGLGFNYDGVLRPFADPLNPTKREGLAFSQLMRETCGVMPSRRYQFKSGVDRLLDQIDSAIRGVPFTGTQFVNTVDEAGGWPDVPQLSIDPLKPTSDHHAPMPLGADRDEMLVDGTFSDGSSKAGYSKLRAWCIEQYFYVMGR